MKWLCKLGLHRWTRREVHVTGPIKDKFSIEAEVIERCECGAFRMPPSGAQKTTQFFMPSKFSAHTDDSASKEQA